MAIDTNSLVSTAATARLLTPTPEIGGNTYNFQAIDNNARLYRDNKLHAEHGWSQAVMASNVVLDIDDTFSSIV